MLRIFSVSVVLLLAAPLVAAESNTWVKIEGGAIEGRRWDVPLAYSPDLKRFFVLGGRTDQANYKKPRPYDVLSITPEKGAKWRNELPEFGAKWGDDTGPVAAPGWKGETWGFADADGNTRPNWSVYGTFSLGGKYDYDPDTNAFYFLAANSTFKYDPKSREWTDLRRKTGPEGRSAGCCSGRPCATTATRRRSSSSAAGTSRPSAATPAPGRSPPNRGCGSR